MTWLMRVDLAGTLTAEQLEDLADNDPILGVYSTPNTVTVTSRISGGEWWHTAAARIPRALRNMRCLNTLVDNGTLTVDRVILESPAARARRLPIVGLAEIALLLRVSKPRVKQLKGRDDWPAPIADLAGGELYWAADIQKFNAGWDRTQGRPKKAITAE